MADVQPVDTELGNETDDEHALISELVRDATPDRFHDYGYGDLLHALRKGYELGRRDALNEERGM